jgi:hypothetical protein
MRKKRFARTVPDFSAPPQWTRLTTARPPVPVPLKRPSNAAEAQGTAGVTKEARNAAKARAYFVLLAIQALIVEYPDALGILRRLPDLPPVPGRWPISIVELLLAIGVYCDAKALVSSLAFRLVRLIAYGYSAFPDLVDDTAEEPPRSDPLFDNESYKRLVQEYAQDFEFSFPPTNQMKAAFIIFWNCPYNGESLRGLHTHEHPALEFPLLDLDGSETGEKWTREATKMATPLELLGHYILYDPAPSDSFNNSVLAILIWYDRHLNETLRNREVDDTRAYVELQREIYDADLVVLSFLERKFEWGGTETDMRVLKEAIPLPPSDDHYIHTENRKRRPVMNGAILEFINFIRGSGFFAEPMGPTVMAERSSKVLEVFEDRGGRENHYYEALVSLKTLGTQGLVMLGDPGEVPPAEDITSIPDLS